MMFASVMLLMSVRHVSLVDGIMGEEQAHFLRVPTGTAHLRREAVCRR